MTRGRGALRALAALLAAGCAGRTPPLGAVDGRLRPCPGTPNCVSTDGPSPGGAAPAIPVRGSIPETMARLRRAILAQPRALIERDDGTYIHATFRSLVWRFVDDAEFLVDSAAGVVHARSASRLGRGDFGVNARRLRAITRRMESDTTP